MRHLLVATALAAGCSFSHGVSTGDDMQQRDAAVTDAPVVIDMVVMSDTPIDGTMMIDAPTTSNDSDADGVPDATDNCPTIANANQRDHDSDGHGDVCDKCPHLASAPDPDGDGDGVGDDCDPRPNTAGDQRVFWEGFYDTSSIASWSETGNGNWTVANGVATQTSIGQVDSALVAPITVPRAAATAGVRVVALGTPSSQFTPPHVSIAVGVAQGRSYWCSVVDEGNGDKVYATTVDGINVNYPSTGWSGTFAANSELRYNLAMIGSHNVCNVVQNLTTATVQGNPDQVSGAVQLATRTASASFDYLFVVSIGN